MYLVAAFNFSPALELAITELTVRGIAASRILAIPLEQRERQRRLFDTIADSDGISQVDGAAALGAVGMTLGVIYGFVLTWGPIIWGLLGLAAGAAAGFLLDYSFARRRRGQRSPGGGGPDVVLLVHCEPEQAAMAEQVLWDNLARSVGRLERDEVSAGGSVSGGQSP